jgi:hypothetical protein
MIFLWGHLKSRPYNPLPKTLDDLKANIERKINKISKNILKSNILNFQKICEFVFRAESGHIKIKLNVLYAKKILFSCSLKCAIGHDQAISNKFFSKVLNSVK